jgi:hypothetical protein
VGGRWVVILSFLTGCPGLPKPTEDTMDLIPLFLRRWLIGMSHKTAKQKTRDPNLIGWLLGERRKGRKEPKRFPYPSATAAVKKFGSNLEKRRREGAVAYGGPAVDVEVVPIESRRQK